MVEIQENNPMNSMKLKLKSSSTRYHKISSLSMQLVTVKFWHHYKFNKNNYRLWFIWTQNSKNGQELLVEFNKSLWTFLFLKLSQIKQIIKAMIKSHSTTRKIVKFNTKNLMNIKMEAVHNKFFRKLNNKFWGKSNKKSKERK